MCQLRGLDFPDQAMLTELEAIERTSGDQGTARHSTAYGSLESWSGARMCQINFTSIFLMKPAIVIYSYPVILIIPHNLFQIS